MNSNFRFSFVLLVSTLLFFISNSSVYSQKHFFTNYGIKEGLAHSQIKDIVQDSNGYVWLGTKIGISKFDGESFINYNSENGLAPKGVNSLCIDNTGTLWMGHFFGGLSILRNGKFSEIKIDSIKSDITSIVQDDKNQIWLATHGDGVFLIENPEADSIIISKQYTSKDDFGNIVFSMTDTESLGMLFVTRYGTKHYNKDSSKWELVKDKFENWPRYFQVITVLEDSKKGIWVGTFNGGLYYYKDLNSKPLIIDKRDGLANNWVGEIVEDIDGSIWVGTWGGGISNIKDGKILSLNKSNGLSENKVKSIFVDIEGNVLIGTHSNGLSIFKSFAFLNYGKFKDNTFVQVNSILQNKENDNLWLATNEGLFNYYTGANNEKVIKSYGIDDFGLQSKDIRVLRFGKQGNIWIGTYGGGVSMLDVKTKKITYVFRLNSVLQQASNFLNVADMDIDSEGHIWVGSPGGLIYYEPETDQVSLLTQGNNLQNNDISSIYCDDNNTVWVGHYAKGITKIIDSEITRYDVGEITPLSIYGSENDLWIGTEGKGVFHYSNGKLSQQITKAHGLVSNMVVALVKDSQGNLYCGTNNGMSRIMNHTYNISTYGEKKGFIGVEVLHGAFYMGNNNNLWAGTALGLTQIKTELLKTLSSPPITFITKIIVNLEEIPITNKLFLSHNENAILIDYKAICISDASSVQYKVRLIGAQEEWQTPTKQTYVNFPALPHGEYRFEVIAKNNSGLWNTEPQSISFTIKPPFWQTLWFISILVFVIIVSIILFIKVRERSLLREKAELETKVQQRTVEISQKNNLLAKKNKDITDSINYARRIQSAIMPTQAKMKELLKSSFIYYRPKDIVSGDFHWNTFHNDRLIVAAADCTGHGVPGAFMSMISISSLNKIVKENQIVDPARILDNMRRDIVHDLKQSGEQAKDGLDIALLSIDIKKNIVFFSGAYNSMYVLRKNKIIESSLNYDFPYSIFGEYLIEVKADRMPIGVSERMDRNFTTKAIQMEKGDSLFISTDGYIDQFGGEKGKKFMSKRFKKLLFEMPYNQSDASVKLLDDQFVNWRGTHEQIDDVLIIGINF